MVGETLTFCPVAPGIGFDVSPEFPTNHWNVRLLPDALTASCVLPPAMIDDPTGCDEMSGGVH